MLATLDEVDARVRGCLQSADRAAEQGQQCGEGESALSSAPMGCLCQLLAVPGRQPKQTNAVTLAVALQSHLAVSASAPGACLPASHAMSGQSGRLQPRENPRAQGSAAPSGPAGFHRHGGLHAAWSGHRGEANKRNCGSKTISMAPRRPQLVLWQPQLHCQSRAVVRFDLPYVPWRRRARNLGHAVGAVLGCMVLERAVAPRPLRCGLRHKRHHRCVSPQRLECAPAQRTTRHQWTPPWLAKPAAQRVRGGRLCAPAKFPSSARPPARFRD